MIFVSPIRRRMRNCWMRWPRDFVAHGYSIKHLERTILNSRAYQLSSLPNASNRRDTHQLFPLLPAAHAAPKN